MMEIPLHDSPIGHQPLIVAVSDQRAGFRFPGGFGEEDGFRLTFVHENQSLSRRDLA